MELPTIEGGWPCIAADPPWAFKDKGSRIAPDQAKAEGVRLYRTMKEAEIGALPVREIAAKDALLFLWSTSAHLLDGSATAVALAWGFTPKATIAWVKCRPRRVKEVAIAMAERWELNLHPVLQIGMGHYVRGAHEHLIICRRGKARVQRRDVPSVIFAPRGAHSAKPEKARAVIESLAAGPRLELFARTARDGWTTWGDQAPIAEAA